MTVGQLTPKILAQKMRKAFEETADAFHMMNSALILRIFDGNQVKFNNNSYSKLINYDTSTRLLHYKNDPTETYWKRIADTKAPRNFHHPNMEIKSQQSSEKEKIPSPSSPHNSARDNERLVGQTCHQEKIQREALLTALTDEGIDLKNLSIAQYENFSTKYHQNGTLTEIFRHVVQHNSEMGEIPPEIAEHAGFAHPNPCGNTSFILAVCRVAAREKFDQPTITTIQTGYTNV